MKRLIFILFSLIFIQQARAFMPMMNNPMMACPWNMQPAQGAYEKEDEEDRKQKYESKLKGAVKAEQRKLAKIDKELDKLQGKIDGRLQPSLSTRVIDHIRLKGNAADFRNDCYAAKANAPSAGSTGSDVPQDNAQRQAADPNNTPQNAAQTASPGCDDEASVVWGRNVQDDGRVNTNICRETSEYAIKPRSSSYASACVSALGSYMRLYDKRRNIEKNLEVAKTKLEDFEYGGGDSDTEGGCPDGNCYKKKKTAGESGSTWMNLLSMGIQVGIPAFLNWQNQKANRRAMIQMNKYNVDTCAQLGYHPGYAGCSMMGRYPYFMGHAQQPYPSMMPGYMGINNGMYGAVPGAMGMGAFGCGAPGMNGMGMPMLGQNMFGMGGMNGGMYGGMNGAPGVAPFMGGQGPWGGTPIPQQGPFFNQTGMPPAVLPYQAGSNPYQYLLLNNQINSINTQLGNPTMPYNTYPAAPAPVMMGPNGFSGSFQGTTHGGTTFFGSGVVTGR